MLYFAPRSREAGGIGDADQAMLKGLPTRSRTRASAPTYKADAIQVLSHAADIVKFDATGKESIAKHIDVRAGRAALHRGDHDADDDGRADHHDHAPLIGGLRDNQALASGAVSNFTALLASGLAEGAIAALAAVGLPSHLQGHRGHQLRPGRAHHARGVHRDLGDAGGRDVRLGCARA